MSETLRFVLEKRKGTKLTCPQCRKKFDWGDFLKDKNHYRVRYNIFYCDECWVKHKDYPDNLK